ncbi:AAA family ATPase [Microvirga sp. GCM10011540]|uniref:AAA family ATPase n=1 Tax=Microvirga sp. GCM10011540 TaxID=3317338 RepID=UPI00361E3E97
MTDENPDGRGSKRVRELAELIKQSQSERNRSFTELPTTQQLYRCFPFHDGSLERDIYVWAPQRSRMLQAYGGQCAALAVLLNALRDDPCAQTTQAAADYAQEILGFDTGDVPARALDEVADARWRLVYYAWRMGSERAAPAVADAVYDMVKSAPDTLAKAELWATAWETVVARAPVTYDGWHRQRGHDSAMADLAQIGLIAFDVLSAKARLAGEQEKRRREEHGKALRDLMDNPAGSVQADIYQMLPDDFEPEVEQAPRPGQVCVGDLTHLPQRKGEGPYTEFLPLSNVRLPARPMPDLVQTSTALKARFPWMHGVIDRALETQVGRPFPALPPLLLWGPPGCGKNEAARALGQALGMAVTEYPCGGTSDATFGSTSRQWHSGRACVPLQAIRRAMAPNPMIVLDELEKAGTSRRNGALSDVLLGMLEPGSRRAYFDAYIECDVDLSPVSFVATCNRIEALRGPLLDRFLVLEIPAPRAQYREVIAQGIVARLREESGLDPRFVPDLDHVELDALRAWKGGSIRPLRRAVERLVALRNSPNLAH